MQKGVALHTVDYSLRVHKTYKSLFFEAVMPIISPFYFYEAVFGLLFIFLLVATVRAFPRLDAKLQRRLPSFDFLKGVAIICIIAIHATDFVPQLFFLRDIIWFAIPLFLLASGYLLEARHQDDLDLRRYFSSMATRILLLYVAFVVAIRLLVTGNFTPAQIALDLFFGRTNGDYYFIPLLISLYLLFPLLRKARRQLSSPFILGFVFLASFFFFILNYFLQQPDWDSNPWSLIFFGRYLFFFVAGVVLAEYDLEKVGLRHLWNLLVGFCCVAATFSLYAGKIYFTYLSPVTAFFLLLLLYNYLAPLRAISWLFTTCVEVGKQSLIIYLIHTRYLYNLLGPQMRLLQGLPVVVQYLLLIVAVLLLSYASARLIMPVYYWFLRLRGKNSRAQPAPRR